MKVLFLSPPIENMMFPSLGMAYLTSILNSNNHEAQLKDGNNQTFESLISKVKSFQPEIVGITMNTTNRFKSLTLAKKIKQQFNIPIVMGGPHATLMTHQLIENYPFIDYIIRSEAELQILELIDSLEKNKDLKKIKSLSHKKEGKIVHNPLAPPIEDLDALPFPEYKFFDLKNYLKQVEYPKELDKFPHGSIISSRGCPYRCTFCSSSKFWGHSIRFRSVESVVNEMKHLYENFNIKFIMFNDDNFTSDKKRAIKICQMLVDQELNKEISWQCRSEVNMMNHELVSWMKRANCNMIEYGVEDASEEGLRAFKKSHTIKQVRDAFKLTHELGIKTKSYFIIGGPHETKANIELKKKFMKELNPTTTTSSILLAYPGTEIYEIGKKQGLFDDSVWLKDLKGEQFHSNAPIYTGPNLTYKELISASAEISYWWGSQVKKDKYSLKDNISIALNMLKERDFKKMMIMGSTVIKTKFKKN